MDKYIIIQVQFFVLVGIASAAHSLLLCFFQGSISNMCNFFLRFMFNIFNDNTADIVNGLVIIIMFPFNFRFEFSTKKLSSILSSNSFVFVSLSLFLLLIIMMTINDDKNLETLFRN
jgi:hypothetical protein